MDGPAPLAKLLEQRRRRRRESDRSETAERNAAAAAAAAAADGPPDTLSAGDRGGAGARLKSPSAVSPLFLTTGTVFMLEVHNSLLYYICQRLTDPLSRHLHFELSDSTVKGEGELKILSRLLHSASSTTTTTTTPSGVEEETPSTPKRESHVVVGGDSDLLLMAMTSGQQNLTLWDDVGNKRHKHAAFSRDKLEGAWKKHHLGPEATQAEVAEMGLNLALLAIICSGNDYLPGCQGLSLQNRNRPGLWSLYLDMRNQPEWKNRSLVRVSSVRVTGGEDEDGSGDGDGLEVDEGTAALMQEDVYTKGPAAGMRVTVDREVLAALLTRYNIQKTVLPGPNGNDASTAGPSLKQTYVKGSWNFGLKEVMGDEDQWGKVTNTARGAMSAPAPPQQLSHNRLPADPEAYMHGLEWVLTMYASGSVLDYRFTYPASSPTIGSIVDICEQQGQGEGGGEEMSQAEMFDVEGDEDTNNNNEEGEIPPALHYGTFPPSSFSFSPAQPLIPAACALALLPARSRRQAATPLRHLMDADSPVAEIFAVCKECQHLASEVRSVASELDGVRQHLSELQTKLGSAGPDAEGAHDAEGDLVAAAEAFEVAQNKLKSLLRDLARSQQEHFKEKHPYKPFPTQELEAAVTAVPHERYPPRERKLARFGREMVFRSGEYYSLALSSSSSSSDQEDGLLKRPEMNRGAQQQQLQQQQEQEQQKLLNSMPGWLKDASRFAYAYPRIGTQEVVLGAAQGAVVREVLPLHPYMQPGITRGKPKRGGTPPSAIYMRHYTHSSFSSSSLTTTTPRVLRTRLGGGVRMMANGHGFTAAMLSSSASAGSMGHFTANTNTNTANTISFPLSAMRASTLSPSSGGVGTRTWCTRVLFSRLVRMVMR